MDVDEDSDQNLDPQPGWIRRYGRFNDILRICDKYQNLMHWLKKVHVYEPVHEISNNVVCAIRKASDKPAHTRSLIRAFASRLSIL